MKTLETEKNNIPEGATHYRDEDGKSLFTWFKLGYLLEFHCSTSNKWKSVSENINLFKVQITPIPQTNLATQTPEEKEALDLIDTTPHQHEVSKFSGESRTKVEYVKVEYSKAWQAAKDHEERVELLYRQSDLGEVIKGNNWKAIQSPREAAQYHFDLYRRIETEIDERQEFIDVVASYCNDNGYGVNERFLGSIFDSNLVKLVESN